MIAWAQEGINVTSTEGSAEEVPTLEEQIQTSITAWLGLIVAIFSAAAIIIRTGIFDRWVKRATAEKYLSNAQMNFVALKGVVEDKALQKAVIQEVIKDVPEGRKADYQKLLAGMDEQIKAKVDQINFYAGKIKEHVKPEMISMANPDLADIPREENNIAYELESIPRKIQTPK